MADPAAHVFSGGLYHALTGIAVGVMFAICTVLLLAYKLNKRVTIEMSDELAERRRQAVPS
jgi:hypothetical protein